MTGAESRETKELIEMANQIFDLEQKAIKIPESIRIERPIRRLKQSLQNLGIHFQDPTGESWDETRTDCEATISGTDTEGLKIKEVIKPIVRDHRGDFPQIIQRGIVIVGK